MGFYQKLKYNISKIIAITEKNIKLDLRFKYFLILRLITPFFAVFFPIIVMGKILEFNPNFGPWTTKNIIVYQIIAYNVILLKSMIEVVPIQLRNEKFWLTLPATIIAPSNRLNLLFGIYLSQMIVLIIPVSVLIGVCFFLYPISFVTLLSIIIIYFLISLSFAGIALTFGIFAVSNENIWRILESIFKFTFILSCITYPFEMFPKAIQNIINFNPFYYIIDILRLVWIEDHILISLITHPIHIIMVVTGAFIFPLVGVYLFNFIYNKYGIVGA